MIKRENSTYAILAVFTTLLFAKRFMIYAIAIMGVGYLRVAGFKLQINRSGFLRVFVCIFVLTIAKYGLETIIGFSPIFDASTAQKEISRTIVYFFLVGIMSNITVDVQTYAKTWRLLLIFIVGVAVIQYTKIFDIDSILKQIYGDSVQFYNSAQVDISKFRCGSVFINPNVFACFLVAVLGSYLFILQYHRESILQIIFTFGLLITGFILAGSRTGFVLGILVLLVCLNMAGKRVNSTYLILFIIGVIVIGLMAGLAASFLDLDYSVLTKFRLFQVHKGITDSLNTKMSVFLNLIRSMGIANIIIGYGPFDNTSLGRLLLVDFDFGYFVTFYGLLGIVFYLMMLDAIWNWKKKNSFGRSFLNTVFIIIFIVFGFTAGGYFNLRIFAIYLLLFLPTITQNCKAIA